MKKYATSPSVVNSRPIRRRPHQTFSHAVAQPWKFAAAAGETRKKYLVRKRLARLAYVLSQFDRTGNSQDIYAAMDSRSGIFAAMIEFEANRQEHGDRMHWSRATLYRYLRLLETAGVMTKRGYRGQTRRRSLKYGSLAPTTTRDINEISGWYIRSCPRI